MKIDPTKIWWLIIVLLPLVSVGACILSESFQGEGYMEAWHDSDKVTDLDWRAITDDFSEADLLYVRSVIDEKLRKLGAMQRKALIRRK